MCVATWNNNQNHQRKLLMTLTKAHIAEALSAQNGYPKNQSFEMIETLLEIIKRTLESGDDVLVSGFGKFCVKAKDERRGRNQQPVTTWCWNRGGLWPLIAPASWGIRLTENSISQTVRYYPGTPCHHRDKGVLSTTREYWSSLWNILLTKHQKKVIQIHQLHISTMQLSSEVWTCWLCESAYWIGSSFAKAAEGRG